MGYPSAVSSPVKTPERAVMVYVALSGGRGGWGGGGVGVVCIMQIESLRMY